MNELSFLCGILQMALGHEAHMRILHQYGQRSAVACIYSTLFWKLHTDFA